MFSAQLRGVKAPQTTRTRERNCFPDCTTGCTFPARFRLRRQAKIATVFFYREKKRLFLSCFFCALPLVMCAVSRTVQLHPAPIWNKIEMGAIRSGAGLIFPASLCSRFAAYAVQAMFYLKERFRCHFNRSSKSGTFTVS